MTGTSGSGAPAGGARSPGRQQNIELLRILAAFGIVLFHAGGPYMQFGYAGLVIFTLLAPFFEAAAWQRRRDPRVLARRLLLPWAAFTLLYGLANLATKGWFIDPQLPPIAAILYGTSPHLWFLPYIFVVMLVTSLSKAYLRHVLVVVGLALALVIMLWLAPAWQPVGEAAGPPVGQWLHALPAVLAGLVLGAATASGRRWIAYLALVLGAVAAFQSQQLGVEIPYAIALPAVLVALRLPQFGKSVEGISQCMMGVYLVHSLALAVVGRITDKTTFMAALLAFALSLAAVWLARRYVPASRYLLG